MIKDYYVKLSILLSESTTQSSSSETISGREQEIELEKIFDSSSQLPNSNKILILGGAGVGGSLPTENQSIYLLLFHEELVGRNGYDRSDHIQNTSRKIKQEYKILGQKHGELEGNITYINEQVEKIDSNSDTDGKKIEVIRILLDGLKINPLEITWQEGHHSTRIIEDMRMEIIKQEDGIQQH